MKRYLFLVSILLSAASVTVVLYGLHASDTYQGMKVEPGNAERALAAILGFAAWMIGFVGMSRVTSPMDMIAWSIAVLAMFFSLDPNLHRITLFEICGLCMLELYLVRSIFLGKMGFLKAIWLDVLFALAVTVTYVFANIKGSAGWVGWAVPAWTIFFSLFKTLGLVMDSVTINKLRTRPFKVDISKEAPDFNLPDQDGKMVKLSDYRGKNCVLLVFVRGDWCPSCHITLRAYERNKEKFQKNNVTVMAIGPDPVGVNRDMVKRLGVNFHVLADEKKECASLYGIQMQDNNPMTKYEQGIPLPATFLVSPQGNVEFTSRADNPGEIFNPEDIFPILEKIAS
ncbi:MAG TPA: peroxiredoxin family protein [Bacteroidia bacterium]|jgi:peroxiredoxin Q/BCP